jgi:AhpD family alkylhydroperoxidase
VPEPDASDVQDPLAVAHPLFGEFAAIYEKAYADGAASALTKELVAMGVAIGRSCESCAEYHIRRALGLGAGRAEIIDAIFVAFLAAGSITTPAVRRLVALASSGP